MTSTDIILLYIAGFLISFLILKIDARQSMTIYDSFSSVIILSMLSWVFIVIALLTSLEEFIDKYPIKNWEKW